MNPGLYEKLLTRGLSRELQSLAPGLRVHTDKVDQADSPRVLTQHLANLIHRVLEATEPAHRVEVANSLIHHLLSQLERDDESVDSRLLQLLSIQPASPVTNVVPLRPAVPLNSTDLLVNARGEHRIGAELVKELQSADRVDLLCSFLKWSGFRLLQQALTEFKARGGKLRVLTTSRNRVRESWEVRALPTFRSLSIFTARAWRHDNRIAPKCRLRMLESREANLRDFWSEEERDLSARVESPHRPETGPQAHRNVQGVERGQEAQSRSYHPPETAPVAKIAELCERLEGER